MKNIIICSVTAFILGVLLGGGAITYITGPRIAAQKRSISMSRLVQLAARSTDSPDSDAVLSSALSRIQQDTLLAKSDLDRGSHIELSKDTLRFAKAFYVYTNRNIPTKLEGILSSVQPTPKNQFEEYVGISLPASN